MRRLLGWPALLVTVTVGLILAGVSQLIEIRTPDRPRGSWEEIRKLATREDLNVVFVLIDTLRADRLSAYGYERATSPIIEALASSGVRFADTLAQSTWTKSSMASLWSSTYPATNRITGWSHGMPEALATPAETLRDAGYRTVGLFRNGWVAPTFKFNQGFDLYFLPLPRKRPAGLNQKSPSAVKLPGTDRDLTDAAVEFLRNVGDDRFLLYLHYMDVHQYVYDGSLEVGSGFSDIYDSSIRWVDGNVGALVAALQELELMQRTLLVIGSDHGEAFYEHGLEGHGRDVYLETTRVPLVIALPFRLRQGIVVETPVENVDIWPTILDLLGLNVPAHADGRSLVPLIEAAARGAHPDEAPDEKRPRFAYLDQSWGIRNAKPRALASVSEDGYRLIRHAGGRVELYDLEADPGESRNVAKAHRDVATRLGAVLQHHLNAPEPEWGPPESVALTDMELIHLRALGYVLPDKKKRRAQGDDAEGDAPDPE
jgi:arylsulfatase A-like enzyme